MDHASGTVFDIKRFAVHDGPGIRTTVFFKGCPLRCVWCQNPESQRLRPQPMTGSRRCVLKADEPDDVVGRAVSVAEVMGVVEKDRLFYDESGGGVTCSGGEPLMQPHFLEALLMACREQDLHTAVDTSGFAPWAHLERLSAYVDLFLYDLKLMDDDAHRKYVQVSNHGIHDNLRRLHDGGAAVIVRVPLIPGLTDTTENLSATAAFLASFPNLKAVHLLPYNPAGEAKYERLGLRNRLGTLPTQPSEVLAAARDVFGTLDVDIKIGG